MGVFDSGSIDNKKPAKPIQPGRQKITLHISENENQNIALNFNKNVNFALEVLKYMPKWELQKYAAETDKDKIESAISQYGEPIEGEDGEFDPSFGEVVRSMSGDRIDGTNIGKYVDDIEFYDGIADFDHLNDDVDQTTEMPIIEDIPEEIWQASLADMDSAGGNFYDLIMKGISNYTPQKAFHLLVTLVESRERIAATYEDIFGSADQSSEERIAAVNNWATQYENDIDKEKLGVLTFFIDTQQSFYSRIMPMYGDSDQFYLDDKDRDKVNQFYEDLTDKVMKYIGMSIGDLQSLTDEELANMSEEKRTAIMLLDKWLNPQNMISPEQNLDPKNTEWGKAAQEKTGEYFDEIIQDNIVRRILFRKQNDEYKNNLNKYEEKEEEREQDEVREAKQTAQKKSEIKKLEVKTVANNKNIVNTQKSKNTRRSTTINKKTSANSDFAKLLATVSSRVKGSSGQSASQKVSKITPAKTARFTANTAPRRTVSAAINPETRVASKYSSAASARAISASEKRISAAVKKSSTTKSDVRTGASTGAKKDPLKQAGTTSARRTAVTKAFIQRKIKDNAPKQNSKA